MLTLESGFLDSVGNATHAEFEAVARSNLIANYRTFSNKSDVPPPPPFFKLIFVLTPI